MEEEEKEEQKEEKEEEANKEEDEEQEESEQQKEEEEADLTVFLMHTQQLRRMCLNLWCQSSRRRNGPVSLT